MNAGPGDAGFSLTDDGLQYESSEFQGWLGRSFRSSLFPGQSLSYLSLYISMFKSSICYFSALFSYFVWDGATSPSLPTLASFSVGCVVIRTKIAVCSFLLTRPHIVCDWWHGVPQLFWRSDFSYFARPSSCAEVDLMPEFLS